MEMKGNQKRKKGVLCPQMNETIIIGFLKEIERTLKKSGHVFLWVDKFILCEGFSYWLSNMSLKIVDLIVWNKLKMGMGYRTRNQCEFLVVLQKIPLRAKGIWHFHDIRNIWEEKIISKKHVHEKPIKLLEKLILTTTMERDYVLDPCAGSFNVFKACINTERNFIGTDISYDKDKQ